MNLPAAARRRASENTVLLSWVGLNAPRLGMLMAFRISAWLLVRIHARTWEASDVALPQESAEEALYQDDADTAGATSTLAVPD